ncbi:MAG: hypothetical protein KF764_03050 [Labilithrix sp.]|nr:hypothetical protein [Labilithrix sp.]
MNATNTSPIGIRSGKSVTEEIAGIEAECREMNHTFKVRRDAPAHWPHQSVEYFVNVGCKDHKLGVVLPYDAAEADNETKRLLFAKAFRDRLREYNARLVEHVTVKVQPAGT